MKKDTNYVWKLGMFVSIGLVLFAVAVYVIGSQKNIFTPTFMVNTVFKDVNGLKIGNNVRFSGINVGTVDNIVITSDTTVNVMLIIQKDVQKFIRKDSRTNIGSEGLMGDKVLTITPGSVDEKQAETNDFLQSEVPTNIDDILASVKISTENIEVISDQLAVITYNINNGKGAISRLIKDEGFASHLDKTMVNLEQSSKSLSENMEAAKDNILLRGYFKKKKKREEQQIKDMEKTAKKQAEEQEKLSKEQIKQQEEQQKEQLKQQEKQQKEQLKQQEKQQKEAQKQQKEAQKQLEKQQKEAEKAAKKAAKG